MADNRNYEETDVVETQVNESPEEKKGSSNTVFGIVCALLVVAIVATSIFSAFNINGFLNSAPTEGETPSQESYKGYNVYSQMVPKYKATVYPSGITPDLIKAYSANNDVVGWLYIPGTNINTPVVQTKDNNRYLRNNFYGSNTNYGTAYADYRCKKNTLSTNTVIYGHNMPSGTHFYDVHRYEDIEWYKKHPTITYTTLFGTYNFLICSVFYTTASSKYDGGYIFNYIFPNMGPKSMGGYLQQLTQRSIYNTGIDMKASDRYITLSTCTHSLDSACGADINGRLVVVGRLIRAGETINVDTSKAKSNPDYRRPQIWYTKRGKTNPYAKYSTWKPSQQ